MINLNVILLNSSLHKEKSVFHFGRQCDIMSASIFLGFGRRYPKLRKFVQSS